MVEETIGLNTIPYISDSPLDAVVRFHVKRDGVGYYRDDSLDNFKSSAILKIESDENLFDSVRSFL